MQYKSKVINLYILNSTTTITSTTSTSISPTTFSTTNFEKTSTPEAEKTTPMEATSKVEETMPKTTENYPNSRTSSFGKIVTSPKFADKFKDATGKAQN